MRKSYYKRMEIEKLRKKYYQIFNCYYILLLFLRKRGSSFHYTKEARKFLRKVKKEELKVEKIFKKKVGDSC